MLHTCIKFFNEYFKIEKIKNSGGEAFFRVYSSPEEMNNYTASLYHRAISKDCILKVEYDDLGDTSLCNFLLGDFKNDHFSSLIEFEDSYKNIIFKYDDEENTFIKIY